MGPGEEGLRQTMSARFETGPLLVRINMLRRLRIGSAFLLPPPSLTGASLRGPYPRIASKKLQGEVLAYSAWARILLVRKPELRYHRPVKENGGRVAACARLSLTVTADPGLPMNLLASSYRAPAIIGLIAVLLAAGY